MKRKTVCEYVEMSAPTLEKEIILGNLPASVMIGGFEHWDKLAIDAAVDRLVNGEAEVPDYERELQEKIDAAKAA